MEIRKAKLEDVPELIRLIQISDNRTLEVASTKVKKFIDSDNGFFLIAIENNKIVGYALFIIKEDDEKAKQFLDLSENSCIGWIAVNTDLRERYIGSKLLKASEEYALKYGKVGIWLDCTQKVVGFYQKNGYEIAGVYEKESPNKLLKPLYLMVKKLK